MRKHKLALAAAAASLMLSGCQTGSGSFVNSQTIGALTGAVAGGVIGHQVNHKNGRYVGAIAGALAGAAIGNYMSQQQQQFQQQLSGSGVQVHRVNESTIQLDIQSEVLFATNQSSVSPNFYGTLDRVSQILQQYPNTIVHVYGFTDRSGRASYNQRLSEQRAGNVAQYLSNRGVNWERFVVRGYGERFATGQNNPADRRVSIFIKAIEQSNPNAAFAPLY